MEALLLSLLAASATAAPAPPTYQQPSQAIPLHYNYGGYPRIETDVTWGTPAQAYVPTIFDTGSSSFWVYGPKAIINDGSNYHFTQGPCNKTVKNFYNWPASKSHSKPKAEAHGFSYGGNGKLVSSSQVINDTFSFTNTKWPGLVNNEVALADYTQVAQLDDKCAIPESDFDHSILGLAPVSYPLTSGPSFRQNLLNQGKVKSSSFSMWFDKAPASAKGVYQGTALFGAVPSKDKYKGELVRMNMNPPSGSYVGYYVSTPTLTATNIKKPGAAKNIPLSDTSVKQCLLDSGTGQDRVPFSQDELLKVTGLIEYQGDAQFIAWNGSCDSIPATAAINYTFAGSTAGKKVTISIPIRSYARGEFDQIPGVDTKKVCGLSLSASEPGGCTFGAPFFSSLFAVFSDEKKQIALAQGGVSTGALDGPSGMGAVTTIVAGQNIPGSV